ncbi:MAG TPA: glycosyltransferase family 39 protein [Pseudomonadales bacterium]|nr:glycosyltransferase family 39 protein [Pseudomonadales bacterium]
MKISAKNTGENLYRLCTLTMATACLFIVLYGLGSLPLLSLNEARRAIPIAGMFSSGNWLLPYLNGELYIDKPPLFYWVSLFFAVIFQSVNEWIFRLPSALSALLVIYASYKTAAARENKWHALAVVVVLTTCTDFVMFARRCEIEMLLTALCAGSLFFAYQFIVLEKSKPFVYASFAFMGAAMLCKGPVALLFCQLPLLAFAAIEKDLRARAYLLCWQGWLLMLMIGASWYVAVTAQEGIDIWHRVIHADIQKKISGSNSDPFYSYAQTLLASFLPWILLLLFTPKASWQGFTCSTGRRFFLYASAIPFLALSLFANKHAKYLLPAYPAFAILFGYRILDMAQAWPQRRQKLLLGTGVILLFGYCVYFAFGEGKIFGYRVQALPAFTQLAARYKDSELVSFDEVDMRTVYYYRQPIRTVDATQIASLHDGKPTLLLIEKEKWGKNLDLAGWQPALKLNPYISKDQTATLYANPAFTRQYGDRISLGQE